MICRPKPRWGVLTPFWLFGFFGGLATHLLTTVTRDTGEVSIRLIAEMVKKLASNHTNVLVGQFVSKPHALGLVLYRLSVDDRGFELFDNAPVDCVTLEVHWSAGLHRSKVTEARYAIIVGTYKVLDGAPGGTEHDRR